MGGPFLGYGLERGQSAEVREFPANLDGFDAFRYNSGTVSGTSIPAPSPRLVRAPKRLLALRADDVLVARVRGGDETAFEVLYERHVPGVLAFCRHMLGGREEGEDAVQQAFVSAHRDLLRGERDVNFKPWLYTIARNRCLSILRARRETARVESEIPTVGLSKQVEQRADLRELLTDLHDLPPDQRAALVLTELEDLSQAEVAEVLGCGVGNVKGLVFRARAGLGERREARDAPCEEIRAELASARRGGLRRGRLRHHLKACPSCAAYLDDVRSQRRMLAAILPVVPTLGLEETVLAAAGIGGGGAAGGAGLLGGGLAAVGSGSTIAKIAVVGALAGGAGVAGNEALDDTPDGRTAPTPPAAEPVRVAPPAASPAPGLRGGAGPGAKTDRGSAGRGRKVRRRGKGTPGELAPGRTRVRPPKRKAKPAAGTPRAPAAPRGRPSVPPGKTRPRSTPAPGPLKVPAARPPGAKKLK